MADQYINYTYAQSNFGADGGGLDGTDPDVGVTATSWPGQVAMDPQTTLPFDNPIYNTAKFGATPEPWTMQPQGPALDPTGAQKFPRLD